jgi:4-hydroxybutyrate CoA-transferase
MKEEKYVDTGCIGKNWEKEYKRRLVSAEEAVKAVNSGDRVVFPTCAFSRVLGPALAARKDELHNVTVHAESALEADLGLFYQDDQRDDVFYLTTWHILDLARKAPAGTDARRTVYLPLTWSEMMKPFDERPKECPYTLDVVMVTVSPPDKRGFCSFGVDLWNARSYCRRAKKVVAQVDETAIRTGGSNHIHVSQIDYFVEATPEILTEKEQEEFLSKASPEVRNVFEPFIPRIKHRWKKLMVSMLPAMDVETVKMMLRSAQLSEWPAETEAIAGYVSELVKDGDTFEIGHGTYPGFLHQCGAFDDKHDLGIYTETVWPGFTRLIENGIVTGKRKNFRQGKVTASAFSSGDQEDFDYINNNPMFELFDAEYLIDIRNIAHVDNFVAINQAISVDLTGQINAESGLGGRMLTGCGGQPELHIGSVLSKGGRAITILPSTAFNGAISSIVPQFEQGTIVTIPRNWADYIVTEYGIGSLMGKDYRQRANELINIAHPDFREELKQEAKKLFYP